MGVKSEVLHAQSDKKKPFPRLMIHEDGDLVVMFTSHEVGFVVFSDSANGDPIGLERQLWNMSKFTAFEGTITLENE